MISVRCGGPTNLADRGPASKVAAGQGLCCSRPHQRCISSGGGPCQGSEPLRNAPTKSRWTTTAVRGLAIGGACRARHPPERAQPVKACREIRETSQCYMNILFVESDSDPP